MGRGKQAKRDIPPRYTETDVQNALDDYNAGTYTLAQSAAAYGVPYGTLYGRVKRGQNAKPAVNEDMQLLKSLEERKIVQWIEVHT